MQYKAFISYSHQDARWGARLHKRLETYRFPKNLIGKITHKGTVPDFMKPVFRDREELSAGANLGQKIQKSLQDSENLIVLCSPRAAASHWVNEEILHFKRHNNPERIYAFIIEGEPFSGGANECLPEALRFELDEGGQLSNRPAEPLAADARDQGDGPQVALLKLLSGMAGLGLDELIQRDLKRARRRVTRITATAISAVLVMGSLTWLAADARQDAEDRRNDAEGLIEFMLTDLRDKLEPVGRLDVLNAVGQEAEEYYNGYESGRLGADSVGRKSTAYHLLGDIQLRTGNINAAKKYFEPVFETTRKQLADDSGNPDRVYEHIQSIFWVAQPYILSGQKNKYLEFQEEYLDLANKLIQLEGKTSRAIQEMAYGLSNVGGAQFSMEEYEQSREFLLRSLPYYEQVIKRKNTPKSKIEMARVYQRLGYVDFSQKSPESALKWAEKRAAILKELSTDHPNNSKVSQDMIKCNINRTIYLRKVGKFSEAKDIIFHTLDQIDRELLREPNSDSMRKYKLSAIDQIVEIELATEKYASAEKYTDLFEDLLETSLERRAAYGFDRKWDYEKPFQYIRGKLRTSLNQQDYETAEAILPKYEIVLNRIKDRNEYEETWRRGRAHYLLTKSYLLTDPQAFLELQALFSNDTQEHQNDNNLIYTLLGHKYCKNTSLCDVPEYGFSTSDLSSGQFIFFKNKHPEIAQTIQQSILYGGRHE